MVNQNAFRRAKEMMAKIQYIKSQTSSLLLQNLFIQDLGPYKSRGHGGKHTPHARIGFVFAQHRSVSKYSSHQGKKEIARRLAKLEEA